MNPLVELANAHPGFGAAPFRRAPPSAQSPQPAAPFQRSPSGQVLPPQPAAPFQRPPSTQEALPDPSFTAAQALRRAQMEQASPASQSSVGSDYQWATLNVATIIGGHTFPAGTRIVVAPSQTSTSGGGKAHTTSIVTKVWAKFGQTFDSSSWIQGAIDASLYTLTGQKAFWSSTGFGARVGAGEITSEQATAAAAGGGLGFVGGLIIGGLIGGIATATVMYLAEQKEEAIYRRAGYSGR